MFGGRDVRAGQKRALGRENQAGQGHQDHGHCGRRGASARPAGRERFVAEVPERLIGDKACDSDRLDERLLAHYGIELIAPNRINRRVPTQDGRPLRRYRRRWKIERLFAWLFNFRRLMVRYEYHAENFQGFCIWPRPSSSCGIYETASRN